MITSCNQTDYLKINQAFVFRKYFIYTGTNIFESLIGEHFDLSQILKFKSMKFTLLKRNIRNFRKKWVCQRINKIIDDKSKN